MLGVTAATRQLAHRLQAGAGLLVPVPHWYRSLTTALLPPRFRQEFDFPFAERESQAAERALHWIRRIYPKLPAMLRFVAPYNEAQQRLQGRATPSLLVRAGNRLWIGQPSLFAQEQRLA